MKTQALWAAILTLGLGLIPGLGLASTDQQIGSWVLSCPGGSEPCLMRFDRRFLDKAGITGDLEVQAQGKTLVPVIALRGLSSEILMAATLAGKTEASIQFAGAPREDLACAASSAGYICAPNDANGAKLAATLPAARSVTVRISVGVAGMSPLPPQEKSLDLAGTNEALARLRAAGPTQVPTAKTELAAQSPAGLMGMADKALKAAGYQNGIAGLEALVAKYMKK